MGFGNFEELKGPGLNGFMFNLHSSIIPQIP
jgi:hypothetical protein